MRIAGRVALVTGGGGGIGAALARRLAAGGAAAVVIADIDRPTAAALAHEVGGDFHVVDVGDRCAVEAMVAAVLARHGRIDLLCANAGVIEGSGLPVAGDETFGGVFASDEAWLRSWSVNLMGQVHAIRAVLPAMLGCGEGHLLVTASAAGLLTDLGSLAYTVTKHASVGLAEWLAITYRGRGIGVSCLCPMGVRTSMLEAAQARGEAAHLTADAIDAETVAAVAVEGIESNRFLILPHPQVSAYFRGKADDPERWIEAMSRHRARLYGEWSPSPERPDGGEVR